MMTIYVCCFYMLYPFLHAPMPFSPFFCALTNAFQKLGAIRISVNKTLSIVTTYTVILSILENSLLHSLHEINQACTLQRTGYYIVNGITVYRLIAAFVLLYLILTKQFPVFKWMLAISFLTDAIDGMLARKLKVVTVSGSRLDSIADDLTVLMAVIAIFVFKPAFLRQQGVLVLVMLGLYLVQLALALLRYGRLSSFHTYLAKAAAILQAIFLVLFFFLPQEPVFVFYAAAAVTILGLAEEILLVILLPRWHTDVKGLWWIKRQGL